MAIPLLGVAAAAEALDPLNLGAFTAFEAGAEAAHEADQFVRGTAALSR